MAVAEHCGILSTGGTFASAAAPAQAVLGSFDPLVGRAAVNASATPVTAPAGGGAARRSGRPREQAPAPEMLRPAVPTEAPGAYLAFWPSVNCKSVIFAQHHFSAK